MKIDKVIKILQKKYKIKPWKANPFKILISTILSQRTKDEVTREASKRLFKVADTPEKILKLSEKQIAKLIYPTGFYRQKAKKIKKVCKILLEKYEGKVPNSREELMKLHGVGSKTASVVLAYGFGIPTIPVDVHVNRISKRLELVPDNYKPEKTQEVLEKIIPKNLHIMVNHLLVTFGKDICRPVKPRCRICPILKFCPYEKKNL